MRKLLILLALLPSIALGQVVNGSSRTISVTPTIDTNIYASGDALGGLQTISGAGRVGIGSGIIHAVVVTDLDKEGADIDVIVFSGNPSATTVTNNAALDVDDADLVKIVCVIQVTSDSAFSDNGVSFAHGNNCVFRADVATGTLYAIAVARGTPTYASASDLTFRYSVLQD